MSGKIIAPPPQGLAVGHAPPETDWYRFGGMPVQVFRRPGMAPTPPQPNPLEPPGNHPIHVLNWCAALMVQTTVALQSALRELVHLRSRLERVEAATYSADPMPVQPWDVEHEPPMPNEDAPAQEGPRP